MENPDDWECGVISCIIIIIIIIIMARSDQP